MDLVETGLTDPANQKPATAVLLGNGDGTFKAAVYYDVADTTGNVAGFTIDDVNGDGIPDIVVPTATSTTNTGVATFTGSDQHADRQRRWDLYHRTGFVADLDRLVVALDRRL